MNNTQSLVLQHIKAFSDFGFKITRQSLAGSLGWPINRVSGRVTELIKKGDVVVDGSVMVAGARRGLLKAVS